MNEKPLTKAVWRTKYKGFPLLFYVTLLVVHFICESVCVCRYVYVCSPLGIPVTGLRDTGWSNARDACDELLLLCCPYVRDLRNCCYCFAAIWAWYLTGYCKLKKKCYGMQEKVKTIQVRQNQNQIWQKKKKKEIARKHLQTKWMLIIWSWCCVCIPVN